MGPVPLCLCFPSTVVEENEMKFVTEFMEEIKQKKPEISLMFKEDRVDEFEEKLRLGLEQHWFPLPTVKSLEMEEFAVDGSMAYRSLINGTDLFFARALLIGSNKLEKRKLRLEALRSLENGDEIDRFLRLLMSLLEVEIVLENIDKLADSVLLMDGSLYGKFTHYYREVLVKGFEDLPLKLISSMQSLFRQCKRNRILLVGISKHSRSRALSKALAGELSRNVPSIMIPSDMEILYRWKRDTPGYSRPLVLGDYFFRGEIERLSKKPEDFLEKFFPSIHKGEEMWGKETLANIPTTPAIVMSYILPEAGDVPLRVDVPVSLLEDDRKIGTVSPFEFGDPITIEKVISHFLAGRGGREVYNALLYVVDRQVRMSRDVVDSLYRSIICEELGLPIEYERGMRRFFA